MECPDVVTDVTPQEAFAILEPYMLAVQERFVEIAPRCKKVIFEVADWVHDSPRHFAACSTNGSPIVGAVQMVELPEQTVLAILAHEFGHATDYLYPGQYALSDGELVDMPPVPEHGLDRRQEQAYLARMRHWERRSHDTIERTADAIAERVMGLPIGYCGPCDLQCFERGRPRPRGLR